MTMYATYQKCSIETSGREDILLNLYEGAILRLKRARQNWHDGPEGKAFEMISQAVAIITELDNTLDREHGEPGIVIELDALYKFAVRELNYCVLRHDFERLQPVVEILETLLSGWQDAARQFRKINSQHAVGVAAAL